MESIVEYVRFHSEKQPDKKAICATDGEITYKQLWDKVTGIAELLRRNGVNKYDHILLEASHTVEYVACFLAIQLSGAVHVTLEHNAPAERAKEIAELTDCKLILTGIHPLAVLSTTFDDITAALSETFDFPKGEMLQEIMFTTGTTGKSKGVMLTHEGALCRCLYQIDCYEIKDDNIWLMPTPMNHAAALRRTQLALVNGNTVVLVDGFMDLKLFFSVIQKQNVNTLYLPPAGVHHILTLASKKLASFDGQFKAIFSSSSVLTSKDKNELNRLLPSVRKYDGYGSSESGPTAYTEYSKSEIITGLVGKPIPGYEVFTVDDEYKPFNATRDNPGIVAIRSKGLACSYWNEPELSADTFRDGVIYMTDMGFFENGQLYLVGRRDDVINIGGLKVSPIEVEEAALKYPNIYECVCIKYSDRLLGDIVKLFVSPKNGCEIDDGELLSLMSSVLESYKIPKRIEHLDEIPHTYNGKIDRKQLINR